MGPRDRIDVPLQEFLQKLAIDRGCFVEDLSLGVVEAATNALLEAYRIASDDAGAFTHGTNTKPAPRRRTSPRPDDGGRSKRPTIPPPGGKSPRPHRGQR